MLSTVHVTDLRVNDVAWIKKEVYVFISIFLSSV